jgi:hypothetical protein
MKKNIKNAQAKLKKGTPPNKRFNRTPGRKADFKPRKLRRRGTTPERSTNSGLLSQYNSYHYEVLRAPAAVSALRGTHVSDVVTNINTLSDSFLEIAMLEFADNVPGADVFRDTEIDSFADYAVHALELIMEFRAMKFAMDAVPGITRNDSSAGAPLTRATWNGLVSSVIGTPIPLISLHIADLFSTPIQSFGVNPLYGYPPLYFYPLSPTYQASGFETRLGAMAAEYDGLAGSNQLNRLTLKFTPDLVQYRRPVPLNHTLGHMATMYYPAADSVNGSYQVRDTTFDMFLRDNAMETWEFDYIGLYCIGNTASWDAIVNTAGAANKVNLEYAEVGATAFTKVADYSTTPSVNLTYAGWMHQQQQLPGASGWDWSYIYPVSGKSNVFAAGEAAMTRRMVQAAMRDVHRPYTTPPGLIQRLKSTDVGLENKFFLSQVSKSEASGAGVFSDNSGTVHTTDLSNSGDVYTKNGQKRHYGGR